METFAAKAAMVDAIVAATTKWISSQLVNEAEFLYGVEDQMLNLQNDLKCMQRYIQDAEETQLDEKENGQVTIFTETIRDIAFNTEDVIDTYILKVGSNSKFTRFACFVCNIFEIHAIGKHIKKIQDDIKNATGRIEIFKNPRGPLSSHDPLKPQRRVLESYAHIEEEHIVGLDDNIKNLVQRITSGMEEEAEWVVSIVGQGGIGKTTLAKKIYNHVDVMHNFSCRAWVCISQQWNKRDILFEILRQIRGIQNEERSSIQSKSDREIIEEMNYFLKNNRYLLVLDDVWAVEAWQDIFVALPRCMESKIIITTRFSNIPRYADQNCFIHEPHLLTKEQGLEIFSKLAITFKTTRFEELGSAMIQKCNGLPLAIVALAGVLRTKQGLNEWEQVNKAFSSIIMRAKGSAIYGRSIDQAFELSYRDLPQYLKPCFLYLSIFPEDYDIPTRSLTQMWIAEGLVTIDDKLHEDEMSEYIADQFLEELLLRYIVQVARRNHTGKVKTCRMHDLMREFCIAKAKEQHLFEILSPSNSVTPSTSENSRRVIIIDSSIEYSRPHAHTRSLIGLKPLGWLGFSSLRPICKDFKLFRVLNLWKLKTNDGILPKEIGNLTHVRYLGLRRTNICELPKSIENLRNLLTLDYRHVLGRPIIVPNVLWKMERLKYLYLPTHDVIYFQHMLQRKVKNFRHSHSRGTFGQLQSINKLELSTLKNLQTLWGVSAGDHMTEELKGLCPCLRKLRVDGISSEEQFAALFHFPCFRSGHLQNILLSWRSNSVQLKSLEPMYEHCQNLQKLQLAGKIEEKSSPLRFPPNLVVLRLQETGLMMQDSITAIGQLRCLKSLVFYPLSYEGIRLIFKAGEFSQLEGLSLFHLSNLEELEVEEGSMPRLKRLTIQYCRRLKGLPQGLCYITMLQELKVEDMSANFCRRLQRPSTMGSGGFEEGEDFHIIKHIPSIQIHDRTGLTYH